MSERSCTTRKAIHLLVEFHLKLAKREEIKPLPITANLVVELMRILGEERSVVTAENTLWSLTPLYLLYLGDGRWVPVQDGFDPPVGYFNQPARKSTATGPEVVGGRITRSRPVMPDL